MSYVCQRLVWQLQLEVMESSWRLNSSNRRKHVNEYAVYKIVKKSIVEEVNPGGRQTVKGEMEFY